MKKLLVIKLGGAVVTYKNSPAPKVRISVIKRLVQEIKQISLLGYRIILVHGAGSFAHDLVKKYDLQHGMKTDQQKKAFRKTQQRMLKLNEIIMAQLSRAGLNAVSLPPHPFISQTGGKLNDFDVYIVKKQLDLNQIPVLFGDMVLDDKWGCSVLSGDTIVCFLGQKLKAEKVIFLSDVDGIYDSDPKKNPSAKLISEINNKNFNQVLRGLSPTGREDVTGEMRGKILQIKVALKRIQIMIVSGLKDQALITVVDQDPTGTRLHFD